MDALKGFWQRSATKTAIALTVFGWMPLLTKWATLAMPSASEVEYAIKVTMEAWLAAFGITRMGAPSYTAPLPPPTPDGPKG